MSHRITSIVAAGLSAVLLGASPASAGIVHRVDIEKTSTDKTGAPIVSARMAERLSEGPQTTPRNATAEKAIVSASMAERGYVARTADPATPVRDDCSLGAPCGIRARDATTTGDAYDRQISAYTQADADLQVGVVNHRVALIAW